MRQYVLNLGIEPLLTFPSLASQFITPYAVGKLECDKQVVLLRTIFDSTNPDGIYVSKFEVEPCRKFRIIILIF